MLSRRNLLRQLLGGSLAPLALRGQEPAVPFLQAVSAESARVLWLTREAGGAWVEWSGEAGSWRRSAGLRRELPAGWLHEVRLDGLPAGERITYRIPEGSEYSFRTARQDPRVRLVVFGDSGSGSAEQQQLGELMAREGADLALHTGDLAYPVGDYEGLAQRHFGMYGRWLAETPLFPCPGNHDYADESARPYRQFHAPPVSAGVPAEDAGLYYRWDWGPVRILSLDSNRAGYNPDSTARMLRWLDAELARPPAFWTLALFHHPVRTAGYHREHALVRWAEAELAPRLRKAGVPLVFNGHDHNYQRFAREGDTRYIVTGGGGGSLYEVHADSRLEAAAARYHYVRCDVDGYRMRAVALGLDGEAFDAFTEAPRPALAAGGAVSAADFATAVAPGGVAAVFGRFLGLGGGTSQVRVRVAGTEVVPLSADPGQVNFVLPDSLPEEAEIEITTPNGSAALGVRIPPAAPAVFVHQGLPVGLEGTARRGERVLLYATGTGARFPVEVEVGGVRAPAEVRRLAEMPGVVEVRFVVPESLKAARHPLRLHAGPHAGGTVALMVG